MGILIQIEDDAIAVAKFDEYITQQGKRLLVILQIELVKIKKI